jgi:hypothetical protein
MSKDKNKLNLLIIHVMMILKYKQKHLQILLKIICLNLMLKK